MDFGKSKNYIKSEKRIDFLIFYGSVFFQFLNFWVLLTCKKNGLRIFDPIIMFDRSNHNILSFFNFNIRAYYNH